LTIQSSPLRVAVNAVALSLGGGATGLMGYLRAWREADAPVEASVYASRSPVIEQLRSEGFTVVPFALDERPAWHFARQQVQLGPLIERGPAAVVWSVNTLVGRCSRPQVIHHQNALRFVSRNSLVGLGRWGFANVVRDATARRALARAQANVFISRYMRAVAEDAVPESTPRNTVIYNGLSGRVLAEASNRACSIGERSPRLAAVQSTQSYKDNETLLRAFRLLIELRPEVPWELTIAGGGDWRRYQRLAKEIGVLNRVTFSGFIDEVEIGRLLRRSLCLLSPSVLEGFGNTLVEAMAYGCPVIACNVGAVPEVVGDAALVVQPRDAVGFAGHVAKLYEDRALRTALIERGRERATRFSWADSASRMMEVLGRVAARLPLRSESGRG